MATDLLEPRIVGPGFHAKVHAVIRLVPQGRVTTYGDVATILGSPRVARHVGWALSALSEGTATTVPWHRVINSRGFIAHRGAHWRATRQYELLSAEDVRFSEAGKVDLGRLRWSFDNLDRLPKSVLGPVAP